MKYAILFTFLVFVLSKNQSIAQEVISNITSEGNEQRHILQEIGDTPYLVKISSLDSLYTYDLSDETPSLLHTSYSLGAYEDYYQKHAGRWLFYVRPDGAVAYDFINDEFKIFPYEENTDYSSWRVWDYDLITLRQSSSDFADTKALLLDFELNVIDDSGMFEKLRGVTEDHYILQERIDSTIIYSALNRESLDIINQLSLPVNSQNIYDETYILYFKNDFTEIWAYDFDSGTESLLHTTQIDFIRQELSQVNNHILYSNYNLDTSYSVMIRKSDLAIKIIPGEILSDGETKSIGNSIIYSRRYVNDSIFIYDFDSESTETYESFLNANRVISINDRYILTRTWENYLIHDTEDGSDEILDIEIPFNSRLKIQELHVGNQILIDLGSDLEFLHDLMSLDKETELVVNSDIIPISKRGLIENTHFHSIEDDIFVLNEEHLYVIVEDSVLQLDENLIIENNYTSHRKQVDGILWAERNDTILNFYKYSAGEKIVLASIVDNPQISLNSFRPYSFFEGNINLYIFARVGFDDVVKLVNKETGEIKSLDTESDPIGINIYHDGYFYYSNGSLLNAIDEMGNEFLIDFESPVFASHSYIKHNNQVFISNNNGIYEIVGLSANKVFDFGQDDISINYFSKLGDNLILNTTTNAYIYKNEQWLPLNLNTDHYLKTLGEEYILDIISTGINQTYTVLYEIETEQTIVLPEQINNSRIVDLFIYNEEKYLITMEGFLPNYTVSVFQMSDDFSIATEVISFETTGRGINATFKPYGDEGLLYAGDKLFLMNDLLEFVPLDDITGDNTTTQIEERDGTFYFIAKNNNLGRQVYNVVAFSERVNTKDITWEELSIYPNPTQNRIQWDIENIDLTTVQIYNRNGKLIFMKSNFDAESIDISNLPIGMYHINIIDAKTQKIKTGRFIKV